MRNRITPLWRFGLLLLCLTLAAGCRRVPEPKTMLLPEEDMEQGVALQGETGDRYAVRKMYSEDYSSLTFGGYTAFLPGTGEHQVRLAESATDGLRIRTLDYRYGFYDTGVFPVGELMASTGVSIAWESGSRDEQNLAKSFFSPDGRYLLYVRWDQTYIGGRLYLMDLETGEEELLLDGDKEECPIEQFMILVAWSRDGSLLCYGFYPRNIDVWNSYMGDKFVFHYRNMETGQEINRMNYYYSGTTGKVDILDGTQLYVDWKGEDILTAIVSEISEPETNKASSQVRIDFFTQKIPKPGMETEGVVIPNIVNCPRDGKLYLDAGGYLYFTSAEEGIICLDITDGAYVSTMSVGPARGIRDFCVLDDGEAFVVAEYDRDHMGDTGPQDICLYTMTEEGMTRRVLYQNAGYVIRLQYDATTRRLLAETGMEYYVKEMQAIANNAAGMQWDSGRRALVLEF